jgi:putative transposase
MSERMARGARIKAVGLPRHVMARGNGRMKIFLDNVDRRKFLMLLNDVVDAFDIECWDYCLMTTHYHLCVWNPQPNLSEGVQYLNGGYALWWNRRHGRIGHVFQGRFKDQIVQRDAYLSTLCRYIALNPVRARVVKNPADWVWSSYRALAGLAPVPAFLQSDGVLSQFGEPVDRQREKYIEHVCGKSPKDDEDAERFRSRQQVIGHRSFKRTLGLADQTPIDGERVRDHAMG